ncbi:MAG: mevalonate kinase [Chloroflexaceae bacterium]|nr:mevalonate kinase [Chloroflexaceae bacterium]
MIQASAPGKLILCGEHAVVYGCPAIALPLNQLRASVQIVPAVADQGITIHAPDLERMWNSDAHADNPLIALTQATLDYLQADVSDMHITITAAIPVASGMGSGAAVATALVRALAGLVQHELTPAEIAQLVYTSEQRYHGTPSGIDNTVIAYEQPIWFVRQTPAQPDEPPPAPIIEAVTIGAPLTLVIADTGKRCPTHLPVGHVRRNWLRSPDQYQTLFDAVATLVQQMRLALQQGNLAELGQRLTDNQRLLEQIGVSSEELEQLVQSALDAGAWGAKLSGGGWGGIMIALTAPTTQAQVAMALRQAGAVRVLTTEIADFDH